MMTAGKGDNKRCISTWGFSSGQSLSALITILIVHQPAKFQPKTAMHDWVIAIRPVFSVLFIFSGVRIVRTVPNTGTVSTYKARRRFISLF